MIELSREEIKADPVFSILLDQILKNHQVAKHTQEILSKNRHVKDFCEVARYFAIIHGEKAIFLHYDTSSWWKNPNGVLIKVESVGLYDNFMEYESARVKQLHGANRSDIPNIN